jgi:hypothetical protein
VNYLQDFLDSESDAENLVNVWVQVPEKPEKPPAGSVPDSTQSFGNTWIRVPEKPDKPSADRPEGSFSGFSGCQDQESPESWRFPWREILPTWSAERRERWGRRANELAEQGVPWPDDEARAFLEILEEDES